MMTQSEMNRLRRQIQRRIRVVLAQRRLDAPDAVRAPRQRPPGERPAARDRTSPEPAPQD